MSDHLCRKPQLVMQVREKVLPTGVVLDANGNTQSLLHSPMFG
jgi:hypothetical protein